MNRSQDEQSQPLPQGRGEILRDLVRQTCERFEWLKVVWYGEDGNAIRSDQGQHFGHEMFQRPMVSDVVEAKNEIERPGQMRHRNLAGIVNHHVMDVVVIE